MARRTKQETETAAPAEATTAKGPTWRIGVFRNGSGKLVTVYVGQDLKTPQPYETNRVGGREILIARQYNGIKYSEARQKLLQEAEAAGIELLENRSGVDNHPPTTTPADGDTAEKRTKRGGTGKKAAEKKQTAKPTKSRK